jgi:uncharacterized membrane protein
VSTAPFAVFSAWLLFAGTHVLFGFPPLRERLATRFGEQRFVAMFAAIAAITLGVLAVAVWRFGAEGPPGPGPALGATSRMGASIVAIVGLLLAIIALPAYPRSPMALFRTGFRPPSGIARITRHGFFVGMTLFASAHALLAATLAQSIHLLGFAVLAAVGAVAQDHKLLQRHGAEYAKYMEATSVVPLVAILQGRQRLTREDRMLRELLRAAAIALGVLLLHPLWSAWNGAAFPGAMAVGGAFIAWRRWRSVRGTSPAPIATRAEPRQ